MIEGIIITFMLVAMFIYEAFGSIAAALIVGAIFTSLVFLMFFICEVTGLSDKFERWLDHE